MDLKRYMEWFELPEYYEYYTRPVKFVATPDGGMAAWKLSWDTGGWEPGDDLVFDILHDAGGEVYRRTKDQFIHLTERTRARRLRGEDAVFALYEVVEAILSEAFNSGRDLSDVELALVTSILRRTYVMFEAELARRGAPGADVPEEPAH
jgi:hypothetical protein